MMNASQLQHLIERIVNDDKGSERLRVRAMRGFTIVGLTDQVERHLQAKRIRPPSRKALGDRVRRATRTLAKNGHVRIDETGVPTKVYPSVYNDA